MSVSVRNPRIHAAGAMGAMLALAIGSFAACSDSDKRRDRAVETIAVRDSGDPAGQARGRLLASSKTAAATATGRLLIRGLPGGTSPIVIGDSVRHPAFLYQATTSGFGVFRLGRVAFLPDLESAAATPLATMPATDVMIVDADLPGFMILVTASSTVAYPTGLSGSLSVMSLAPDRLPEPLPPGATTRAAYAIEPFGTTFSPPAVIDLPNVDGLPPGASADLWRVDPQSGLWERVGPMQVDLTGVSLTGGTLDVATMVAALPTQSYPVGEITGRVSGIGGVGAEGYPVSLPGSIGVVSAPDGSFRIAGVPLGAGMIRVHTTPHSGNRPEAVSAGPFPAAGSTTDVGDIAVLDLVRDVVAPGFTSSPADEATSVDENISIRLTFNEPMDTGRTTVRVAGPQGDVSGTVLFSSDGLVLVFEPSAALSSFAKYYIIVEDSSRDLASNQIPEKERVLSFRTRPMPSPPPLTISLLGLSPTDGSEGDLIDIVGRNFPGGSLVTVGGVQAQVTSEASQRIRFRIPPGLTAGNLPVSVAGIGSPTLSVLPAVDDLAPPFGDPGGGYPIVITGRSLGPSSSILIHGTPPLLSTSQVGFDLAIHPVATSELLLATGGGGTFRSTTGASSWISSGVGITESIARSVSYDPQNPTRVYLGTLGGGVMVSGDSGQSWLPSTVGLLDSTVLVVEPDLSTAGVVLAGTAGGLFRSVDAGGSWSASDAGISDRTILSLAQDPILPSNWFAGTTGGIYLSIDGGITWARTGVEAGHASITALAIDPGTGTTVYAGTYSGRVFSSTDAGVTWSDVSVGLTGAPVASLAVDPATPSRIFAGTLGSGARLTTDSGLSWFVAGTGLSTAHVFSVVIDPTNSATIYAATEGAFVFKSADGGATWSASASGVSYTESRVIAFCEGTVPTGAIGAEVAGLRSNTQPFLARRWPDRNGPAVIRVDPPDAAAGVAVSATVRIVLSETVAAGSMFTVADPLDPLMNPVPGSFVVTVVGDVSEILFQPLAPLSPATTYSVTVTAGVTDIAGNPTDQDALTPGLQGFTSNFTTQ
ncbi:MAG: Ig-like domain-containing protein [Planctomycetota bacterium]|nr:Ig-like domain-containing protein [Planctomycetota bacterium]